MQPLRAIAPTDVIMIAVAAPALPLPTAGGSFGVLPTWWVDADWPTREVPGEIELEVWADGVVNLSDAVLYGARLHPWTFADKVITSIDASTNTLTLNGHNLQTGDGPLLHEAQTTYPGGLSATMQLWAIRTGANTFQYAASRADALEGTPIDLTSAGTGTQRTKAVAASPSVPRGTERLTWTTHDGLLGLEGDGVIELAPGVGYSIRLPHSPRVIAYSLEAIVDTGAVSAAIVPVQDAR